STTNQRQQNIERRAVCVGFIGTRQSDAVANLLFFFQAEDGIRDLYVTGVQTWLFRSVVHWPRGGGPPGGPKPGPPGGPPRKGERSEERRVGKECRDRWSPDR